MKKMVFGIVMIAAQFSANCMSPDRKFEYSEAQRFFDKVDGHDYRGSWANGNSEVKRLTLDFDGRKQFIGSVRGSNEHTNNFIVTVEASISHKKSIRREFKLENSKYNSSHYTTTYLFFANGKAKPYLYNGENGILDDFISVIPNRTPLYSNYINHFATNVLRILKISKKHLKTKELTKSNLDVNKSIVYTAVEIAAMILTTERARDEYSLLISYIEFYKLKHTNRTNQQEMLLNMFNKNDPILRFPKAPGGAPLIQDMQPSDIYDEFMDMLPYSPYYLKLQQLPEFMHDVLVDLFYEGKLEKIKAISENQTSNKTVKFKKLVDASEKFFKFRIEKVINLWKALVNNSEGISEPELELESDYFDPSDPAAEGHHEDEEFRDEKSLWELEEEYRFRT